MVTSDWTELHDYNQRIVNAVKGIMPILGEMEATEWLENGGAETIPEVETIRELLREKEEIL